MQFHGVKNDVYTANPRNYPEYNPVPILVHLLKDSPPVRSWFHRYDEILAAPIDQRFTITNAEYERLKPMEQFEFTPLIPEGSPSNLLPASQMDDSRRYIKVGRKQADQIRASLRASMVPSTMRDLTSHDYTQKGQLTDSQFLEVLKSGRYFPGDIDRRGNLPPITLAEARRLGGRRKKYTKKISTRRHSRH